MGKVPAMSRSGKPRDPDGRSRRWETHRLTRRAELISAVVTAVRERGPAVDMDAISAVSGIAKPVFYRYFSDKADLFLAVGRDVAERVTTDVVAAVDAERDPRGMVAAGVGAFLRAVERDPELYRFVLHRPLTAATVQDYSAVVGKHIARLTGDLLRSAGLDSGVAEPWGFAMVGAVRAAAERWLDQPTMSRDALAAYLTELLWSGCRGAIGSAGTVDPEVPRLREARPSSLGRSSSEEAAR